MTQSLSYVGSSAIITHKNRLLFEIQKPEKWKKENGTLKIGLACIGGHVEPNETIHQTLQREAQEEIGCNINLQQPQSQFTYYNGTITPTTSNDLPQNVWFTWENLEPGFTPGLRVAVFLGHLTQHPKPNDLPGILSLDFKTFLNIKHNTLQQTINTGATLIENHNIPRNAYLSHAGTSKILADIYHQASNLLHPLIT